MKSKPLNAGVTEFAAVVKRLGPAAVARRLNASEPAVRAWAAGQRAPSGTARGAIAVAFGIVASSWTTPSKPVAAVAAPTPSASPRRILPASASAKDIARAQVDDLGEAIRRAEAEGASFRDIAALQTAFTSALRNLARVSGELEVSEATILRSAAWARLQATVRSVLERHPQAAKDLAVAIENYAAEGR